MSTYTQDQILDMAMEDASTYSEHNGLELDISRATMERHLDIDTWEEVFNTGNDSDTMYDMAEDVADIVRRFGTVTTRLQAEVERDGEKFLMTWIPENVSRAYAVGQWAFAFDDEDNPPYDGQIHQETGDWQIIAEMCEAESLDDLEQGTYFLEPISED